MQQWIETAKQLGFDTVVALDPAQLVARADVREMCKANTCGAYGENWMCPPACGSLEQCQASMHGFTRGILLQTIGYMQKPIDSRCYLETERRHMARFYALVELFREQYPEALCLGAGGCRVCKQCAYPEPCRFPQKAVSSMEAYGLFVTQVCRDAGVPYHHGDRTVTYTACVLW